MISAVRPDALRSWLGFAGFYCASFAALGIYMQFFPAWLHQERGFREAEVAVVLSALTIARTVAGPLWSQHVDRRGDARTTLLVLSALSLAVFTLFRHAATVPIAWGVAFLYGCVYPPTHAITDAAAVAAARAGGFSFGRLRMIGSLAFLIVIVAVGQWLDEAGTATVFPILWIALAATLLAGWFVPRGTAAAHAAPGDAPLLALLRRPAFLGLLLASALIQGSHATFYNLSTVHWNAHGIGKGLAALIWAGGVLAEIALFFMAPRLCDPLRPTTLLMVGGAAAVLRWCIVGATTSAGVLLATSWLHALSFAATFLGAIRALERRVPPHQRATAQGLLAAANSGVGMVACGLVGGFVYEHWPGGAFFAMAGFALCGTGLALGLRLAIDRQTADHG